VVLALFCYHFNFPRCSMLGSYSSRFNYAGKNPTGLDVPSDIADKKQVDEAQKN
jgi:hypothetical protein